MFRLSLTLGNIPSTPRFLFHDRFLLSPPNFTTDPRDTCDLLAVIALPGFQFAIQLECSLHYADLRSIR